MPERPKGAVCKIAGEAYGGSNPPPPTTNRPTADTRTTKGCSRISGLKGSISPIWVKGAQTSVRSCRGAVVLMDEPTEPVPSPHLISRSRSRVSLWLRRIELQPAVRTLPVVVVDEFLEHAVEVPSTEDERPVEALVPCGAHPSPDLRGRDRGRSCDPGADAHPHHRGLDRRGP